MYTVDPLPLDPKHVLFCGESNMKLGLTKVACLGVLLMHCML